MTIKNPFITHRFRVEFQSIIAKLAGFDNSIFLQMVEVSSFILKPGSDGVIRMSFRQDNEGSVLKNLMVLVTDFEGDADRQLIIHQLDANDQSFLKVKLQSLGQCYLDYAPLNYGKSIPHTVDLVVEYQKWQIV